MRRRLEQYVIGTLVTFLAGVSATIHLFNLMPTLTPLDNLESHWWEVALLVFIGLVGAPIWTSSKD